MDSVTIFSPATVANVNCGFDVLGFAFDGIGDEMVLHKTAEKGIKIKRIEGADLPTDPKQNVAGVAGLTMLNHINADFGITIEIKKNIRLGSGIGSSAASAAGVVFGINQFLDDPLSLQELTYFGMKGEAVASGHEHADNVAPSVFGGFTLIPSYQPFQVLQLPVPSELYVTIIHPHLTVKTKEARSVLPESVLMRTAISHSGHLAGFVSGLYKSDYKMIGCYAQDVLVEPFRKSLIPYFEDVKQIALQENALCFGISGSGPSLFTLCKGQDIAEAVEKRLKGFYIKKDIAIDTYVSKVSEKGSRVMS